MKLRRTCETRPARTGDEAFTLVEIAICLGIIGFALVAIIGILPAGLQVQRDNKEDTIINQEGTYLMQAIRNGAEELEDLQRRVEQISVETINGSLPTTNFAAADFRAPREVIGVLSHPSDYTTQEKQVRAVFYAGGGSAVEAASDVSFRYQVTVRNYAFTNSNLSYSTIFRNALSNEMREVRLDFRWPVLPGGGVGAGRHVFRAQVSALLAQAPPTNQITLPLYFFIP